MLTTRPDLDAIKDTRESKFEAIRALGDGSLLPPVYIISHNRPGAIRTLETFPALRRRATIVVADEEYLDYKRSDPDLSFLPIPQWWAGLRIGVGRARQFCLDVATQMGEKNILLMDDDVAGMTVQYGLPEGGASSAFAKHVEGWRDEFRVGALTLFALTAAEAFEEVPGLTFVGPQVAPGYRGPEASSVRWETNRGRIPCHLVSWHVRRFNHYVPAGIDLDHFNRNAEDLYAVMTTLWRGGSMAKSMSFTAHPGTQPSVVAVGDVRLMYREQYDALMAQEWAHLLYTKFVDGEPTWSRPDWRRIDKVLALPKITKEWGS